MLTLPRTRFTRCPGDSVILFSFNLRGAPLHRSVAFKYRAAVVFHIFENKGELALLTVHWNIFAHRAIANDAWVAALAELAIQLLGLRVAAIPPVPIALVCVCCIVTFSVTEPCWVVAIAFVLATVRAASTSPSSGVDALAVVTVAGVDIITAAVATLTRE